MNTQREGERGVAPPKSNGSKSEHICLGTRSPSVRQRVEASQGRKRCVVPKINLKHYNTKKETTGLHWNKCDPPQDLMLKVKAHSRHACTTGLA